MNLLTPKKVSLIDFYISTKGLPRYTKVKSTKKIDSSCSKLYLQLMPFKANMLMLDSSQQDIIEFDKKGNLLKKYNLNQLIGKDEILIIAKCICTNKLNKVFVFGERRVMWIFDKNFKLLKRYYCQKFFDIMKADYEDPNKLYVLSSGGQERKFKFLHTFDASIGFFLQTYTVDLFDITVTNDMKLIGCTSFDICYMNKNTLTTEKKVGINETWLNSFRYLSQVIGIFVDEDNTLWILINFNDDTTSTTSVVYSFDSTFTLLSKIHLEDRFYNYSKLIVLKNSLIVSTPDKIVIIQLF